MIKAEREESDERRGRSKQRRNAHALHRTEHEQARAECKKQLCAKELHIPRPRRTLCCDRDEMQRVSKHRNPLPLQTESIICVAVPQRPFAMRKRIVLHHRVWDKSPHRRAEIRARAVLHFDIGRARQTRKIIVERLCTVVRRNKTAPKENNRMTAHQHRRERSEKHRCLRTRKRPRSESG